MRVVLDTNVLARAASGPPGLANELVLACTALPHDLVLSPFILSELNRVLHYERLRPIHGLTDAGIDKYLAELQAVSLVVAPRNVPMIVAFDPDDDAIVATAVAGQADIICTLDRDLKRPDIVAYCRERGIEILSDHELLQRIRSVRS